MSFSSENTQVIKQWLDEVGINKMGASENVASDTAILSITDNHTQKLTPTNIDERRQVYTTAITVLKIKPRQFYDINCILIGNYGVGNLGYRCASQWWVQKAARSSEFETATMGHQLKVTSEMLSQNTSAINLI